jgi:nitroimidazol reductase NimA-like FMN-containing flavoprotein (pyridoxamine 5'-phosphate oxidase superfamily)
MDDGHVGTIDSRFSAPDAEPASWAAVVEVLETAELFWITSVRAGGRPHVTPLVGVWFDGAFHFTTGPAEQKARNVEGHADVAVTTGTNTWASGLDVVVEGRAVRVTDRAELQRLADTYDAKYAGRWHFEVGEDGFGSGEQAAWVYRVRPDKVLAFAKEPHAQTRFVLDSR